MQNIVNIACFLFDNGSLRAASTLSLRKTALALEKKLQRPVQPVSLLHSSGVDTAQLDGRPAELLEPAVQNFLQHYPEGEAVLLPLFFGPSGALTDYVPGRMKAVLAKFPGARVRLAKCLVSPVDVDTRIAETLAAAARRVCAEHRLVRPKIVLVDHGSPQPGVVAVRDHLGRQVRTILSDEVVSLSVASMERRPGPDYAFGDPLLVDCLRKGPNDDGDVVVLLQFLSPGRHAGPGGDIADICEAARREKPGLRTYMTEPIGGESGLIDVLAQRYREALAGDILKGAS